ncbi:uncharacterized protein BXZ73DRAFT_83070 [Epithele typhae]|uniref:uncharacterized protein n=1 Tax=Epithele typhae TaxID=378194 RepID=UPI0020081ED0|nr:uncharacterized protein BXZ73DRAFT_83070 [Epithele typhae]KAH9910907.1 hypothetical protein BXZ73DRAFT_83070 [Epithele typhae]
MTPLIGLGVSSVAVLSACVVMRWLASCISPRRSVRGAQDPPIFSISTPIHSGKTTSVVVPARSYPAPRPKFTPTVLQIYNSSTLISRKRKDTPRQPVDQNPISRSSRKQPPSLKSSGVGASSTSASASRSRRLPASKVDPCVLPRKFGNHTREQLQYNRKDGKHGGWAVVDADQPVLSPPTFRDESVIAIGDVLCWRTKEYCQLWLRVPEEGDKGSWQSVSPGFVRADGLVLSITELRRDPSWVRGKWGAQRRAEMKKCATGYSSAPQARCKDPSSSSLSLLQAENMRQSTFEANAWDLGLGSPIPPGIQDYWLKGGTVPGTQHPEYLPSVQMEQTLAIRRQTVLSIRTIAELEAFVNFASAAPQFNFTPTAPQFRFIVREYQKVVIELGHYALVPWPQVQQALRLVPSIEELQVVLPDGAPPDLFDLIFLPHLDDFLTNVQPHLLTTFLRSHRKIRTLTLTHEGTSPPYSLAPLAAVEHLVCAIGYLDRLYLPLRHLEKLYLGFSHGHRSMSDQLHHLTASAAGQALFPRLYQLSIQVAPDDYLVIHDIAHIFPNLADLYLLETKVASLSSRRRGGSSRRVWNDYNGWYQALCDLDVLVHFFLLAMSPLHGTDTGDEEAERGVVTQWVGGHAGVPHPALHSIHMAYSSQPGMDPDILSKWESVTGRLEDWTRVCTVLGPQAIAQDFWDNYWV